MTAKADKPVEKPEPGSLVPGRNGGLIRVGSKPGMNRGGSGRPRDELRAMLRDFAWEKFPTLYAKWKDMDVDQRARVVELGLRYGLGTQTEAVTPDDMKDAATRIVNEVVTILLDEEHWPLAKVQAVAARITRAAQGTQSTTEG